jgi:protein O-GlcNAc transferase
MKEPGAHSDQVAVAILQAMQQAAMAFTRGEWAEAERCCRQVLAARGDYFDALNLSGFIAAQMGRTDEAASLLGRAVGANPGDPTAHINYGNVLKKLKRFEDALDSYERALKVRPDYPEAYNNRGNTLQELKRFEDALDSYDRALKVRPDYAEAYNNRGNALRELRRFEDALDSYEHALKIRPDYAEAYNNHGVTLQDLQRFQDALDSYGRALKVRPDYAEAYNNRGNTLQELKRFEDALDSYERALKIRPDYAEAHTNRGNALRELRRFEDALDSYERALKIRPDYVEAHTNRGNALRALRRFADALHSYECALKVRPDLAEAYNNRGVTLHDLQRFEDALDSYERALRIRPDYAEAHTNRGNAMRELGRFEDALDSYERALKVRPDLAEAHDNRGGALRELGRFEDALDSYERAMKIKPDLDWLYGAWVRAKLQLCDWADLDAKIAHLLSDVGRGKYSAAPFGLMAFCDSPALQRQAAQLWVAKARPPRTTLPASATRARRPRIRLGYYSSDYGDHPVAHLAVGLFEEHDRKQFEVVAFSSGPSRSDEMSDRLKAAFDRFVDVPGGSDRDVAQLSRDLGIDIAVDLMGFTGNARTGVFAERAAPIQVNYLGYPGTMAAPYIDYLIADATVIPLASRAHYAEKIVYLPHSFQPNDRKRQISELEYSREELGLPPAAFVFCAFNNTYKIAPAIFSCWMRILGKLDGSVLWLASANEAVRANLRREAAARGVSPERLIFAGRLSRAEDHLARHRAADLFLDTYPFNAHTTASNALWAGLPVLTCIGDSYAARVAASLLNAVGLPELVATTQEQYEAMAVELASDPARLTALKEKLDRNRLTMPLFDTELFTRHLEDAYTQMYERYQGDLSPEHIYVPR